MANILVVDDEKGIRDFLEIMLTEDGHRVQTSADAVAALVKAKKTPYDLVITDLKMPRMDGLELIRKMKESHPEAIHILITAFASRETVLEAMKEGVFDYLEKDFDIDHLRRVVADALKKRGFLIEDAVFLKQFEDDISFSNMIGKSREMLKIYSTIKKVAATKTNVLILGESGTGKELVAKAIHNNSIRKDKPFIVINCGGIPETLLESELFGHVRGAFTGANTDKPGLFELAHQGAIFLDEVAELPPLLQVKLLRAVQEKTFRRVGGQTDINVDVRIIAATNRDLKQKVTEGSFREDLYYRLNVIPVVVPPLRERKEDIPILTKFFIDKYSREFGKEITNISSYAMEQLMEYPFPGNVRELENIIERCIALETSNIILPDNLIITTGLPVGEQTSDANFNDGTIDLDQEINKYEKSLIEKALLAAGFSKTKTARLLRISYDSLKYRIEKLGIGE